MLYRPSSPQRLLEASRPHLLASIEALPGAPWDAHTSHTVADLLGVSPQALNDWRYQRVPCTPPHEPRAVYGARAVYFRKDRLMRWAGHDEPLWQVGARYIGENLGFEAPTTATEADTLVRWLIESGLIRTTATPRIRPFQAYRADDDEVIDLRAAA